jgi:hypothetical protein
VGTQRTDSVEQRNRRRTTADGDYWHPQFRERLLHNASVPLFSLVAGEIFLQRLIEIMPPFGSKRQVVDIANQIESDISAYLLTITAPAGLYLGIHLAEGETITPMLLARRSRSIQSW